MSQIIVAILSRIKTAVAIGLLIVLVGLSLLPALATTFSTTQANPATCEPPPTATPQPTPTGLPPVYVFYLPVVFRQDGDTPTPEPPQPTPTPDGGYVPPAVDEAAPITSAVLSGTVGSEGWFISAVEVILSVMDEGTPSSGVNCVSLDDALYTNARNYTAQGETTVTFWAVDNAGNHEPTHSLSFKIDTVAPGNPSSAIELGGAMDDTWQRAVSDPAFTWSGAGDVTSGLDGYFVYFGPDPQGASSTFTATPAFDPPAVGGSGTRYLRVQTRDHAGNLAVWQTIFVFRYDADLPSTPTDLSGGAGWQAVSGTPTFSWNAATDALAGIAGYDVDWNGSIVALGSDTTYSPGPQASGSYTFRVRAHDNAGNVSTWSPAITWQYDAEAPTIPQVISGAAAWQSANAAPEFNWGAASDMHSGLAGYEVEWNGAVTSTSDHTYAPGPQASGLYTFRVRARDGVGNLSAWSDPATWQYDDTPPINPSVSLPGVISGVWQNSISEPHFTLGGASDEHSGVAQYWVYFGPSPDGEPIVAVATASAAFAPVTSGEYVLRVQTEDAAGNRSAIETLFVLRFDGDAPGIPDGLPPDTPWQNQDDEPEIAWGAAVDAASGVVSYDVDWDGTITPRIATTYDPGPQASGVHTFRVRTHDQAGNVSAWSAEVMWRYDAIAPAPPADITGATGWQNANDVPGFAWAAASEADSGVAGYDVEWDGLITALGATTTFSPGAQPSGSYTFRVRAHDNAGNVGEWSPLTMWQYDHLAPAAPTIILGESNWQNADDTPTFTWDAAGDAHSGLAQYQVEFDGVADLAGQVNAWTLGAQATGSHTFRVRAQDGAENWSAWSEPATWRYDSVAPLNPGAASEIHGVGDGDWQGQVSTPAFTWIDASDADSGLAGYRVYFGPDSNGTGGEMVGSAVYTPTLVLSEGIYYLRLQALDRASNAGAWATAFTFCYDQTAPQAPEAGSVRETAGGVATGVWQSQVTSPFFLWDSVSDAGSGVAAYVVYFGPNPAGQSPTVTVPGPFYGGGVSASGTYYLRARVVDRLGNSSNWVTLFEFRYDREAPGLFGPAVEAHGVGNGAWARHAGPVFTWQPAADAHSGTAYYHVYFGPDPAGTGADIAPTAAYSPTELMAGGDYFLRVQAHDAAGNAGAWATAFTYRYDGTPPTAPISALERSGVPSGVWQSEQSQPTFTWTGASDVGSGVAGYEVYFGLDSLGQPETRLDEAEYTTQRLSATGSYYLRVAAVDAAGNLSTPHTLFTFRYQQPPPPRNVYLPLVVR